MTENAIRIERTAQDKKTGMTVGDLWAYAQDALTLGIDPRTPVKVTTGWRMQIQKLEAGGSGR
jgi:hypothetical protein